MTTKFGGWGNYPLKEGRLWEPSDPAQVRFWLHGENSDTPRHCIPRGAGRSYGDSALAEQMIGSRYLDYFLDFDAAKGMLRCAAGVTLEEVLQLTMPAGWFLPVVPGTAGISVAGAIASDVHGKNHHRDGCFSCFVDSMSLMLASGEIIEVDRQSQPELFRATCGGMGLTGIILDARLQLRPLLGATIRQQRLIAPHLSQVMEMFDEHGDCHYSVAWLDCLASGNALGRSVLFLGEHGDDGGLELNPPFSLDVPFATPGFLLNRHTMGLFNRTMYYWQKQLPQSQPVSCYRYFFPLDRIRHWNRLYGRRGFLQYQLVIPAESAREGLELILRTVSAAGKGSFLSVLKKMGSQNDNLLSFPLAGYTLALDFRVEPDLFQLLDRLDSITLDHGGRLYLAKDARMGEHVFKAGYPAWEKFLEIKHKVDPKGLFSSQQSRRLGL